MEKKTKIIIAVSAAAILVGALVGVIVFKGDKTPPNRMGDGKHEMGTLVMTDWNDEGGYFYKYSDGSEDYFLRWGEYVFTSTPDHNDVILTPAPVAGDGRNLAVSYNSFPKRK